MSKLIVMLSTYNGEKYLDKQLESIFNQDADTQIQLVARDDGSKDNTLSILKKWKKNNDIEIIQDGESLGAAKSFWKLLHTVGEADYYAFVDQDDVWDKDKIRIAVKEISASNMPILWFSNCRIIDENGSIVKERLKPQKQIPPLTIESEIICGSSQGCAMVFNRAAYEAIQSYRIKEIPMHDIVLMEYIIGLGRVIYHSDPLFSYRVHGKNVVAKQGKSLLNRIRASYKQWFVINKGTYRRMCKELLYNLGDTLNEETKSYLTRIIRSKKSLAARISIVKDPKTTHYDKSILRSFKMRVMLGII